MVSKLPKEKARAKNQRRETNGRREGETGDRERRATSLVTTRHKDEHCTRRNGPEAPKTKAPFLSGGRRRVAATGTCLRAVRGGQREILICIRSR